jgi:hypothetical protein
LHILPSGGHLMVGQGSQVRALISRFLHGRRAARSAKPPVRIPAVEPALAG